MDFMRGVAERAAEMGQAAAQQFAHPENLFPHAPDGGGLFGGFGHGHPPHHPHPQPAASGTSNHEPPIESTVKPPPASTRTLATLPAILVAPEDLSDPNNRECCICFESHPLKSHVTRLPCAHIFHSPCILDWLKRSCTCPVCRLELPTDDPTYESGRKKRMATRKPRYARYELDRMTARQLRELALNRLSMNPATITGLERPQLIAAVVDSGKIEVVAAPKPVEHRLSELRALGPKKLRLTMEEAGVFFSKEDVVEKSDMIELFLRSGRIALVPEQEEETEEEEEVLEEGGDMDVDHIDINASTVKNPNKDTKEVDDSAQWSDASSSQDSDSIAADLNDDLSSPIHMFGKRPSTLVNDEEPIDAYAAAASFPASNNSTAAAADVPAYPSSGGNDPLPSLEEDDEADDANIGPDGAAQEATTGTTTTAPLNMYGCPDLDLHLDGTDGGGLPNVTRQTRMASFAGRSVSQLRSLAAERDVDVSDCIEKREMISRLADAEAYVQT